MTTQTTSKSPWLKRIFMALGTLLILAATVAGIGLWQMKIFVNTPADSTGDEQTIIIETGENLKGISKHLSQKGLITEEILFRLLARYRGVARQIQAGEYAVSSSMTPEQILNIFVKGLVNLHRLTIPEGLNLEETALLVEAAGFGTRENFLHLARDPQFSDRLKIKADNLEGYLFPETYFFRKNTSQKKIIQHMVERFNTVYTPQWRERSKELGFTVHEIVILASIIEKETGDTAERPIIASVFHNRLKRGMRLESDPTVIYGIHNFNGDITRKDLQTVTPYNTYQIKGLPRGPIANPGKLSLEAALFPAATDFLFFVSKKDTTHKFSTNFRDHNQAVRRYQLGK